MNIMIKSTYSVTHVRLWNSTSLEFLKSFDRKRTIITLKERRKWPKASRSVSVGRWNYSVHVFCISLLVACTLQNPPFFRCTWLGSCRILILLHSHCMFLARCRIIPLALYEILICLLIIRAILFLLCSICLLLYVHCMWFEPCEILLYYLCIACYSKQSLDINGNDSSSPELFHGSFGVQSS